MAQTLTDLTWSSSTPRLRAVAVLGTGSSVPSRILSNADLETMVDTSDEWIRTRTGIRERRIVDGLATSDLAIAAAKQALAAAEVTAEQVDMVIVATMTPDEVCPPVACRVQAAIGATRAGGFDLSAACSGFMNALFMGERLVGSGAIANCLVIGADAMSTLTDYQSRDTCVLFGDAAGAVLLGEPRDGGRILDQLVGIDGSGADMIVTPAGGSRRPATHATVEGREHFLQMNGKEVYKFAVQKMPELVEELLVRNGLTTSDISLLVPHQANLRILEAGAKRLGIPLDRVMINVDRFGNTAAGSVPLALDEAVRTGRIHHGDLICLTSFGGGLSWAGALIRW
ncbi:MAG: ketoacyl-ACP synthase III [Planctomycetes bacterium]|nr:ketoacyl-ACP synthase III [Planctomycetota bacterium]MCC7397513.1 ketoacyl-ACP synthase III [Planctomycetota bacterium]